jgi:hypothetical protein
MKKILLLSLSILVLACGGTKTESTSEVQETPQTNTSHHSASIAKVFDAHGGFDNWSKLKMLTYENGGCKTTVELQNRYTRIESETQTVGFDGDNVWVYPPSENADRQRMRYNLMFYFYAFPFVVGDPGVNYEAMDPIEIKGETYNTVKVTYNAGIGDAPNDSYIILSNQQTDRMEWLMYTATFGGAAKDSYSLIKYGGWKEMGGVILPSSLQWYSYADGEAGDPRGGANLFENIEVSQEYPSLDKFIMPEGAQDITNPAF